MYFVIEDKSQLSKLDPVEEAFVQVIAANDNYHPKLSRLSLVYYHNSTKGYVFVINHSEGFSLDVKLVEQFLNRHKRIYLLDKKYHLYFLNLPNSVDVQFTCLDKDNQENQFECGTPVHRDFYTKHSDLFNINEIIPIAKHYEKCQCLYDMVKHYFGLEMDVEQQNALVDAYKTVEEAGVKVDMSCFNKRYEFQNRQYSLVGNTLYSWYNLYNLTARPTNSFNGVNFLAIPKEKGFRECFVPSNDFLVEFDFDAYHLRLISRLTGFQLPKESMHVYLGKQYFGVEELTEEQYKESKTITFKQLYGGVEEQYSGIDFFASLNQYVEKQWKLYRDQKALTLPTGRILRYQPGMSKLKLFNYTVQNLETKENTDKITRINALLKDKRTKLTLITYDSFLFDFCQEEGKDLLKEIKSILESGDTPVKLKYGTNYAF
jgi:hypothetical protein